jgi:hypothetical protein
VIVTYRAEFAPKSTAVHTPAVESPEVAAALASGAVLAGVAALHLQDNNEPEKELSLELPRGSESQQGATVVAAENAGSQQQNGLTTNGSGESSAAALGGGGYNGAIQGSYIMGKASVVPEAETAPWATNNSEVCHCCGPGHSIAAAVL